MTDQCGKLAEREVHIKGIGGLSLLCLIACICGLLTNLAPNTIDIDKYIKFEKKVWFLFKECA